MNRRSQGPDPFREGKAKGQMAGLRIPAAGIQKLAVSVEELEGCRRIRFAASPSVPCSRYLAAKLLFDSRVRMAQRHEYDLFCMRAPRTAMAP